MKSASGIIYRNGEFTEGHAVMEDGTLVIGSGRLENAEVAGIILPGPVNCHTHLGDAFIGKPNSASVEELVAPPDGLKHRMLANVSPAVQLAAMEDAVRTMEAVGTSAFMDFREGGLKGARILSRLAVDSCTRPVIFGRPEAGYSPEEMDALLEIVDGIGMSAVSDMDREDLKSISRHARRAGKAFAIHASEARQENSDEYLDLKPDLLVHMVKADSRDLAECSAAKVPVIVCPRANAYFGLKPPVREMLDAGITVCLGTDNAMLASPDIFAEMRFLARNFDLTEQEVFSIVFENGRKVLNSLPGLQAANSQNYLVMEISLDEPWKGVLEARPENIRLFDTRG